MDETGSWIAGRWSGRGESRTGRRGLVGGRGGAGGRGPPIPSYLPAGYRSGVTVVQKGCWTGPLTGETLTSEHALPPDYSSVRGCNTHLCNANLMSHDSVPNLSPGVRGVAWRPGAGRLGRRRGDGYVGGPWGTWNSRNWLVY